MNQYRWFTETFDPKIKGLSHALMVMLDDARGRAGVPFIIMSGLRSPIENEAAGGVDESAHLHGLAADLRVRDPYHAYQMIKGLLAAGARRLILGVKLGEGGLTYHNLHVDIDISKPSPLFSVVVYK